MRNDRSIGFSGRQVKAVGLAGLFCAAAAGGYFRAQANFGSDASEATAVARAVQTAIDGPVAVAEDRSTGPVWDLPNLDHPRVDYFVEVFTTRKRAEFARFLQRSGRYVPMISEKLEERGMPQDLIYLAMIESGFNPTAYSHAHASGLWQFIADTGRRYGLDINAAVDERRDPVKATDAALSYLQYLHRRFDSWYLAAAAYNTGENRVGRIMRQVTGSEKGNEHSYYRISGRLPRETRDYVPLMIAAARIAKEPEKYGFEDVPMDPPMHYDEVTVEPAAQLSAIARATGSTVAEIKRLNPQLKLERTRNDRSSAIRVPVGTAQTFAARWPEVRRVAQAAPARTQTAARNRNYRVRRGDNLTRIARNHGVTISSIRRANGIRGDRIRAGQVLRIPG